MYELLKTILSFIVALGVLVTIHEFGHFWVARLIKVKVLRFSVGFGKPLISWRDKQETEYCIASLPLGGYVKLLDAREAEVPAALQQEEFSQRPVHQRIAVYAAGPFINLAFAGLLYWLLFLSGITTLIPKVGHLESDTPAYQADFIYGEEIISVDNKPTNSWEAINFALVSRLGDSGEILFETRPPDTNQTFIRRIPIQNFMHNALRDTSPLNYLGLHTYMPDITATIGEVLPNSPAQEAGLQKGDLVTRANEEAITSWRAWVNVVRAHPAQTLSIEVQRQTQTITLTITPETIDGPQGKPIGRIGAAALEMMSTEGMYRKINYGILESAWQASAKTLERIEVTLSTLGKMIIGKVSVENLSGPITIAQIAADTASYGLEPFLNFLAYLSISLGVLNLLPIPVLDGGHILFGLFEWLRGKPLSEKAQTISLSLGLGILSMLMAIAFYNDLARLAR